MLTKWVKFKNPLMLRQAQHERILRVRTDFFRIKDDPGVARMFGQAKILKT